MKKPSEVPQDIYNILEQTTEARVPNEDEDRVLDNLADAMRSAVKDAVFAPAQQRAGRLRLSSIGKEDRKLWLDYHDQDGEPIDGQTYMKFLYGHVVEALVLALAELAGHTVTGNQDEVEVNGVKGHIDGSIDGVLCDVKSASGWAIKKFRGGTLHESDDFGYIHQLAAYAKALQQDEWGWLAVDKAGGEIVWMDRGSDEEYNPDVEARVDELKLLVERPEPARCYEPVPHGASGNTKLAKGCSYCPYKAHCFPDAKAYGYSNGPVWLVDVVKEPRVNQLPEGF